MMNNTVSRFIDTNIKTDLILKEGADILPKQVIPSIQPVYEVNKKYVGILRNLTRSATASATIYATPSDRDFFLCGFSNSVIKDATCDDATGVTSQIELTIGGVTRVIGAIPGIVTTASSQTIMIDFNKPIKIDRGTNITLSGGTYTAGLKVRSVVIWGYLNYPSQPERQIEAA